MVEFYKWIEAARLLVPLLLVFCVAAQTLAMIFSYFRYSKGIRHFVETLLELAVLFQIIVLSALYGNVLHGYYLSMAAIRHVALSYVAAAFAALSACVVMAQTQKRWLLLVIAVSCLTLPAVETATGGAYVWLYIAALLYWLLRGVHLCILRFREITGSISSLSVKNAVDSLPSGILFSAPDGHILLVNKQMQKLMVELTGKVQRDSRNFYETLVSGRLKPGCEMTEYEGHIVCRLPDETAWMFIKTELRIKNKVYNQLTATDVTERWALTARLQKQEELLTLRSGELRETIANIQIMSREKELQNAKLHAHDTLGRRLTLLFRSIYEGITPDYELIRAQTRNLSEDLKASRGEASPMDKFRGMRQAYKVIGVEIFLGGELPEAGENGHILTDAINEATANAVRHGFATEVFVRIDRSGGGWHVTITDNGRPPDKPITEGGIGGMRRKIEMRGGSLLVTAHPRFTLEIGLPEEETDV